MVRTIINSNIKLTEKAWSRYNDWAKENEIPLIPSRNGIVDSYEYTLYDEKYYGIFFAIGEGQGTVVTFKRSDFRIYSYKELHE